MTNNTGTDLKRVTEDFFLFFFRRGVSLCQTYHVDHIRMINLLAWFCGQLGQDCVSFLSSASGNPSGDTSVGPRVCLDRIGLIQSTDIYTDLASVGTSHVLKQPAPHVPYTCTSWNYDPRLFLELFLTYFI